MLTPLQQFGLAGERWAAKKLETLGYRVVMLPDFCHPSCDLMIEGCLPCEVKLASVTTRRRKLKSGNYRTHERWQFNVSAIQKGDKVLILLALDGAGEIYPFVMPASIMALRPHFQLTSHPTKYSGLIAPFLDQWDVVKFLLGKRYQDRPNDQRELWEVDHAK